MTEVQAGEVALAAKSSGYSVYGGARHVVFVIAPSFGYGLATLIVGGLCFLLAVNGVIGALGGPLALGLSLLGAAVPFGVVAYLLHGAWKRHASAGLDWPNRYVFDRQTGTLVDGKGRTIATGDVGARRTFRLGSRSVFVELVVGKQRLPVYQVYTGGLSRGAEADELLARLTSWGIPTRR